MASILDNIDDTITYGDIFNIKHKIFKKVYKDAINEARYRITRRDCTHFIETSILREEFRYKSENLKYLTIKDLYEGFKLSVEEIETLINSGVANCSNAISHFINYNTDTTEEMPFIFFNCGLDLCMKALQGEDFNVTIEAYNYDLDNPLIISEIKSTKDLTETNRNKCIESAKKLRVQLQESLIEEARNYCSNRYKKEYVF